MHALLTSSSILVQCSGSIDVGTLQANWTVQGDSVEFIVSAQTTGWVGIGFSNDQLMVSIHIFELSDTIGCVPVVYYIMHAFTLPS